MVIEICIGSACHVKGSYEVINTFKRLVEENGLKDRVELKSSFCLGNCSDGPSVRINNEHVISVFPEEAEKVFFKYLEGE
ncbi:MAG: (2Fe-2S) ferredoxin domain-containing protein [Firmicutes bacterium]|jgi:NADH:ubiquinone oxidoreductase subunit E|nr:(2Fe-2S) ferredoxin domain-containing protein [Bacillota bacterium]